MLELGIGMPVLLLFLFGTADFGRAFYVAIEVSNAAREDIADGHVEKAPKDIDR